MTRNGQKLLVCRDVWCALQLGQLLSFCDLSCLLHRPLVAVLLSTWLALARASGSIPETRRFMKDRLLTCSATLGAFH